MRKSVFSDKPWAGYALLAAVGVLVAILLFEVAIRFTPYAEPHTVTYDSVLGWQLIPNASGWHRSEHWQWFTVNSGGMRDVNISVKKPPNTFRIAVLGDSFTEADVVPMHDAFFWVMQRRLRACPALSGKRVQVLNFGVRDYGTAQELLMLRERTWRYSPDFVVLAIYTGNDIRNNSVALEVNKCRPFWVQHGDAFEPGGPFIDSPWFRFRCFARFESRYSQTADMAGNAVITLKNIVRSYTKKKGKPIPGSQIGPGFGYDALYLKPTKPVWQRAWRVTDWEITQVARDVARHNVPFLAVTLSNPVQVYPDAKRRRALAELMGVPDLFYPDRHITKLGSREGFPVLNLAPPMAQYADAHHAYLHGFPPDLLGRGHWNATGHHVAGRLIAERICQMLSEKANGVTPTAASALASQGAAPAASASDSSAPPAH